MLCSLRATVINTVLLKSLTAKALLFDLDGTLADTAPDLSRALNRVLQTLDCVSVTLKEVRCWVGDGTENLLKRAVSKTRGKQVDVGLIDKGVGLLDVYYSESLWVKSVCYPGVLNGLAELKRLGFKLACVTNKPRLFSSDVLKQSGLHIFFDVVVAGNDLPERKPSPMPLLYVAQELELDPSECIVIGDSKNDAEAALRAGMMVLLVTWGYHQDMELSQMGATELIQEFSEISNLISCHSRR